ncbi:MAG: hypothetical protein JWM59_3454 [Verrucomicrobiales bacterium]|nr:hypothetical protein [Verrucomicrobiales bacterium]
MRKTCLPAGRRLLSALLLLGPPVGLAGAELDLFEGEKIKPQPLGDEGLLDSKLLELEVKLPDFPAVREADEKDRMAKNNPKAGWALLSENVRKDFAAFSGKVAELRRGELKPDLEKAVLEVKEKAKLDAEGAAKLDALAESAMNESLRSWEAAFMERYAPDLLKGDAEALLKSWKPEQFTFGTAPSPISPARTEVWKDGLRKMVTPEYYAAAAAEAKAAREEALQAAGRILLDAENRFGGVLSTAMDAELESVFLYVELDETREKAIRKAAEDAVKDTLKRWRERAAKRMEEMEDQTLKQVQQIEDLGVGDPGAESKPQDSEIWRTARSAVLTENERQSIAEGQERIKQRRAEVLAMTVLAEVDQQVGFSEAQREKLLALCSGRFLSFEVRTIGRGMGDEGIPDPGMMLPILQGIPDDSLAAVLDPGQTARWKAVSGEDLSQRNFTISSLFGSDSPPAAGTEPVDELEASRLITLKLADESVKIREKYFSRMEGKVENLARVTALPPETTAKLRTAGKGAAEQLAQNAVGNMEQNLMNQVRGVKPAELPGRLAKISLFNGYQERGPQAEPPLWEAALKRLLTKSQREIWQHECRAGQAWRRRALSAFVSSGVEQHVRLSPEKSALLLEKLEGVLQKYESDINNMISPGWQYQSFYSAIPVALLTEKEMAGIFTPKQLETVRTRCLGQVEQFATMIRRRNG